MIIFQLLSVSVFFIGRLYFLLFFFVSFFFCFSCHSSVSSHYFSFVSASTISFSVSALLIHPFLLLLFLLFLIIILSFLPVLFVLPLLLTLPYLPSFSSVSASSYSSLRVPSFSSWCCSKRYLVMMVIDYGAGTFHSMFTAFSATVTALSPREINENLGFSTISVPFFISYSCWLLLFSIP